MDDVVKSENENKQPPVIEASKTISQVKLIDKPYVNLDNDDPLGISSYSLALSKFIEDCECPITIGLQGEWGSGKTSMFRAVEHKLTSGTALFEIEGKKQAYRVNKSDKYKVISINSWEHALLKSPQEALLSIIDEISGQIAAVDGTYEKNEKIKSLIGKVAKSAARVGASAVLGNSGGQAVDEIFNTGQQDNTIKQLRSALSVLVQSIVNRKTETSPEKFVVFIDDLDRLVPSDAVDVMELLKNIFDIDYCVFVLAIDYDVVVQGLMKKFGEPNDNNEWQFRAFFDKIIQLPFMMPIGAYKIHNYLEQLLGGKNSSAYFGGNEKVDAALESIVKYSVGPNPRGLKRLANSLRLIKLHYEEKNKANKESETSGTLSVTLKRVIFALVCIQISYPKIFEFLKRRPNFTEWDEKFVSEITGGEHIDDKELNKAFNRAVEFNEADFDDPWEQSLFKLVWKKTKNKNRAIDISRLLSIIEEKLVNADDFEQTITNAIDQTAVTSVVSTDGDINSENTKSEDSSEETLATQQFWERLKKKFGELSEEESAGFDAIRKGAKSGQVYRDCSYFDNGKIGIFIATSNFVKFEISLGLPKENYKLATYLESCISEISNHIDYVATIVPVEDKVSQELRIAVKSSTDIPNRGPITKHKTEVQDLYIDQAFEVVPKLNNILKKKIEQYSALNESIPAPADSSVNVPLYESSKENLENNNSPINSDTSGESGSSDSGDKINVNS